LKEGEGKMRKMKFVFVLAVLATFALVTQAAEIDVMKILVNGDFEQPGTGKTNGFDIEDGAYDTGTGLPVEVPGWESVGVMQNSGVETPWITDPLTQNIWGWDPPVGATQWAGWSAYLQATDGAIWNTSTTKIVEGDTYTLDYMMGPTGSDAGWTMVGQAVLYAINSRGVMTVLDTQKNDFSAMAWWPPNFCWMNFSFSYTATADVAGQYIGAMFDNIGTAAPGTPGNSWIGVDIPEPATLILLGLGGLLLRRKR